MPLAPPAVPSSMDAPPDIRAAPIQRGLRILQLSRERKVQRSPDRRAALIQRGRLILQRFREHREQQLQQLNMILEYPIQMMQDHRDPQYWHLPAVEDRAEEERQDHPVQQGDPDTPVDIHTYIHTQDLSERAFALYMVGMMPRTKGQRGPRTPYEAGISFEDWHFVCAEIRADTYIARPPAPSNTPRLPATFAEYQASVRADIQTPTGPGTNASLNLPTPTRLFSTSMSQEHHRSKGKPQDAGADIGADIAAVDFYGCNPAALSVQPTKCTASVSGGVAPDTHCVSLSPPPKSTVTALTPPPATPQANTPLDMFVQVQLPAPEQATTPIPLFPPLQTLAPPGAPVENADDQMLEEDVVELDRLTAKQGTVTEAQLKEPRPPPIPEGTDDDDWNDDDDEHDEDPDPFGFKFGKTTVRLSRLHVRLRRRPPRTRLSAVAR